MQNSIPLIKALKKRDQNAILKLNSPQKIQTFLDSIPYSSEPIYRCPLQVLQDKMAHCFDGALFAAAILSQIGYQPLILDMIPNDRDDDHLLALFKKNGYWGAVAKSNFAGLRFREPIYRNLRELVLSYFEQYYNLAREKTLRGYTIPLNLKAFNKFNWMTSDASMEMIAQRLDEIKKYDLMTPDMVKDLSTVDNRLYEAGLLGANEAGLYKPKK